MINASEAATKGEFVLLFSMSVSVQKDFTRKEMNVSKVDFPIKMFICEENSYAV